MRLPQSLEAGMVMEGQPGGRVMWEALVAWVAENAGVLSGGAAFLAIVETVFKPFRSLFRRTETVKLDAETKAALTPVQPKDGPALTVPEFIRLRRELKEDLLQELAEAPDAEKEQLRARIAKLEDQIANPDEAFAEAQRRIVELEALLERSGNQIGGDRLAEARAALEQGDYSIADDLFAEIEERRKLEVREAARAAFGRGEIAEAEVRWGDAAAHYARAVELEEELEFETLFKASEFARLAGEFDAALSHGSKLLKLSHSQDNQEQLARALNEHALMFLHLGRYAEAETFLRQALEKDASTIGERHPTYASHLNNLAKAVQDQGRYTEAETLFRNALEIDAATIGEGHPDYAKHLNNLANGVLVQRRYAEAEALYVQALEIGKATIGERHPSYAIRLNNLAAVVQAQGRFLEAEVLYVQALEIYEKSLGAEHPNTRTARRNLERLLSAKPD